MKYTSSCFVSVVSRVRNDAPILAVTVREIMGILRSNYENYELILVDEASNDESSEILRSLVAEFECLRVLRLSRRCGIDVALVSGLETAIGDFIVTLLPDCDPPRAIPALVAEARRTGKIIQGVNSAPARMPIIQRIGSWVFRAVSSRFLGIQIDATRTHLRAMPRQALNAILSVRDRFRYLRLVDEEIGYPSQSYPYAATNASGRADTTTLAERAEAALSLVVSRTTRPLRIVTWAALAASVGNLAYIGYVFVIALFKKHVAEGWVTLSLQHASMFLMVFVILAVCAEYLGRLLDESRDRPLYYVKDDFASSVTIAHAERRNVVTESRPN